MGAWPDADHGSGCLLRSGLLGWGQGSEGSCAAEHGKCRAKGGTAPGWTCNVQRLNLPGVLECDATSPRLQGGVSSEELRSIVPGPCTPGGIDSAYACVRGRLRNGVHRVWRGRGGRNSPQPATAAPLFRRGEALQKRAHGGTPGAGLCRADGPDGTVAAGLCRH